MAIMIGMRGPKLGNVGSFGKSKTPAPIRDAEVEPKKSERKPAYEQPEVTPEMLHYSGAAETCQGCAHFTEPSSCSILLDFDVEPGGHCLAFSAKQEQEEGDEDEDDGYDDSTDTGRLTKKVPAIA